LSPTSPGVLSPVASRAVALGGPAQACSDLGPSTSARFFWEKVPATGRVRAPGVRCSASRVDDDQLKLHAQVATTPSVVVVASSWPHDDDEPAEIVEKLTEKLKLSYDQSKQLKLHLAQGGKGYVLEKLRITRSKDLRNAGGFFIRALEKDYREPVKNVKPAPPPKKKRIEPKPEEPPATDEERAQTSAMADEIRAFIQERTEELEKGL
jgi:hypothetical protein